jgi:hypothetical protein
MLRARLFRFLPALLLIALCALTAQWAARDLTHAPRGGAAVSVHDGSR